MKTVGNVKQPAGFHMQEICMKAIVGSTADFLSFLAIGNVSIGPVTTVTMSFGLRIASSFAFN